MRIRHACWLSLPLLALSTHASANSGFGSLISEGKPILDLRYRHESVMQDNALHDAEANTLRTRLGFRSGSWHGFSGLVELDNVTHLGNARFNDTRNGRTGHSVVADPDGTAINQAALQYSGEYGNVVAGRQRINLDNQRFIGGVAWRQNEQTFDGALLQWRPRKGLDLTFAWFNRIHTVFGPDDGPHATAANRARIEGDSHLLNLRYEASPRFTASAYQYRLGMDNAAVSATAPLRTLSSTTTGLRLHGLHGKFSYAAEYARQTEQGGNPWELDSKYHLLELGYQLHGVQLKAGHEVLGGGEGPGNRAFQTPLATKHLFQGWADTFLTTPANGLEDTYVGVVAPVGGGMLQFWHHAYSEEQGGASHGNEVNVSYARAIPGMKKVNGLLKYARYDAGRGGTAMDTDKFWLQLQYGL